MVDTPKPLASPFGQLLHGWRRQRGLSQLALSIKVGSTTRHLSFLETGRSRPSRQMVLRLSESLQVPLRERNQLLQAAGLPAAYPSADLADADLAPYRAAIDRMLDAHRPYPALVVDAYWTVVAANQPAGLLYGADIVGANIVDRFLTDPRAADTIVNWQEVAWSALSRLRHQLALAPFDQRLRELVDRAQRAVVPTPAPPAPASQLMICPWFRIGDQVVRTISMVARFEPANDITLDELRIELTYPMDGTAEQFFRSHPTNSPKA